MAGDVQLDNILQNVYALIIPFVAFPEFASYCFEVVRVAFCFDFILDGKARTADFSHA